MSKKGARTLTGHESGSKESNFPHPTPDWVITEPSCFHFLVNHPVPRPWHFGYWHLLKLDVRYWKVIAIWVVGSGFFVLGLVLNQWPLVISGVIVFGIWLRNFLYFGAAFRNAPLVVGAVDNHRPHHIVGEYSTTEAQLRTGRAVAVCVRTAPIAQVIKEHTRAEVLFLHARGVGHSLVIGVRAISEEKDHVERAGYQL